MFDFPYIIEILSPVLDSKHSLGRSMEVFAEKYRRIVRAGLGVSIPDNPMGRPRHSALETIACSHLPVESERTIMNLNTFHTRQELDSLLGQAAFLGLKYILVVRGDGGPQLPTLDPEQIGSSRKAVASSDLIGYITSKFPGRFIIGAAFNPYNPAEFELKKAEEKIEAGARFFITQPIFGKDPLVERLAGLDTTIVVEAWMSDNADLLYKSIRKKRDENEPAYDPVETLKSLHASYPRSCVYLSLLSFKDDWRGLLPRLDRGEKKGVAED